MSPRFFATVLVAAAAALMLSPLWPAPALAEAVDPEPPKPVEPPSTLPRAHTGDKAQNLDRLFDALSVQPGAVLRTEVTQLHLRVVRDDLRMEAGDVRSVEP